MTKLLGIGLAAVAIGLAGAGWWMQEEDGGHGALPVSAARPTGGDFTLQTANGPISLHDLRGKVVLLYFGYTHCPDVCPVTMASGAQALTRLTPEERGKTRLLFVSLDPERDTPAKLKDYTAYFHADMIGATGTPEQVAAMARAYGAGFIRQAPAQDGSYAVDHSTQTYVIDPNGKLVGDIDYGVSADKVVDTVRKWLS